MAVPSPGLCARVPPPSLINYFIQIPGEKIKQRVKLQKIASFAESKHDTVSELSDEEDEVEGAYPAPLSRIISMNKPEKSFLLYGVFASILFGATFPAFAIVFGEIYKVRNQTLHNILIA